MFDIRMLLRTGKSLVLAYGDNSYDPYRDAHEHHRQGEEARNARYETETKKKRKQQNKKRQNNEQPGKYGGWIWWLIAAVIAFAFLGS